MTTPGQAVLVSPRAYDDVESVVSAYFDSVRQVAVLIGILVAASFGSGDFLGGLASRRASTLLVLVVVQVTALAAAVVVALLGGGQIGARAVWFGAGAGLLNVAGLGCLYRGLAVGQIGQVAPVAAVVGAVLPITWGLARGERPSALTMIGVVLAVMAAALISSEREERRGPLLSRGLPLALAAGVGFGTSFILFAATPHTSGFWPVLGARLAAVAGVALAMVLFHTPLTMVVHARRQAIGAGLLDVSATALLLVALRRGLTAVVAPVASLAPAFTVMHAWWVLHERATRIQLAGLVAALAGLVLITAG